MNNLLTTTVNKLLYDGEKYRWTGSLNELKEFVDKYLQIKGEWTSPGGHVKLFTAKGSDFAIKWYGPRSQKLMIEADSCDHYLEEKLVNLSVGKQVSEGELHVNKDDALKSSGPCSCSCKCSGGITAASLEGLKLDIAILESRLNLANPTDEILSELGLIRSKQQDVEAIIRKQDEIICKLHEDNMFFKSKLQSFINLIPAASHNNQENNTGGKISFANNVCKSPSIVSNENKDCASGDSLILLDEPQLSDVENKAPNPTSVINKEDEPSTRTSNQYHENNISDSANVINFSVEKSSSCHGEQLHEIGKSTTSNKMPKESFQQSRKSSIPCPYLFGRGWCIKASKCDYSHQNTGRKKNESPKSEVPCPFLKKRGFCLKGTRCDFLHLTKPQPSARPKNMSRYVPTYPPVPLHQPSIGQDTRPPFLCPAPWPATPPFPPSLMNVPTWPPWMY
jgi:hypothetical protein